MMASRPPENAAWDEMKGKEVVVRWDHGVGDARDANKGTLVWVDVYTIGFRMDGYVETCVVFKHAIRWIALAG